MWLVKTEDETNGSYGEYPQDRTVEELIKSSVVIIDKQSGPTSHQVTKWVKDIFQVGKAGHVGTLDPAVTGVLPIVLGNSVKAMPVMMGLDKEYIGVMYVHRDVEEKFLRDVITNFIGRIKQLPPLRSAVARREREREIYYFDILELEEKDVLFKVGCEAGTYIRKLCHDIGQSLKVGAHMAELRRLKVGSFTEEQSYSLLDVRDAYEFWKEGDEKQLRKMLIPIEHAILHIKRIFVKDSAIDNICNGSPVYPNGISKIQKGIVKGEIVAIYSLKEELIALGISKMTSEEMVERKKGVAIRNDRVFMEKGTYPTKV